MSCVVNCDLLSERAAAQFDPVALTHFLDGGPQRTTRRRHLESWITQDSIFSNVDNSYLSRAERHARALAKFVRLVELCRAAQVGVEADGEITATWEFLLLVSAISDDPLPTSLHWIMFRPNILTLCDEQQQSEWLPLCRDWKMIGCYAQTELGHGSNIRALETTATFLSETHGATPNSGGEWIIHSPTLTSTKFWPGTLGKTANHAMVIARLIDGQGVDRGIHNFLVPLRRMDDHSLLPGVQTGDVGPKIGYNNMDNGYATFDKVRIPRRNMAMRFATVDEHGTYTKRKGASSDAASKVAYITMMQVRAYIIYSSNEALAMACTIAIRYSAVRRQGYDTNRETLILDTNTLKEIQVIDYRQQQYRLFPLLAASYAIFFTGRHVIDRLKTIENQLVEGATTVTKTVVADIHATTSALKSYVTTFTADGIEDCRKACGGHGYLVCSGLVELSNTYLQSCTVEGDNNMLPQQVVKVLLKLVGAVQAGKSEVLKEYELTDMGYLITLLQEHLKSTSDSSNSNLPTKSLFQFSPSATSKDFLLFSTLLLAFQHRTACLLLDVAKQLQSSTETSSPHQAWNDSLPAMAQASRAHACYLLLRDFSQGLDRESHLESRSCLGAREIAVLSQCLTLLALYWLDQHLSDFLQMECLSSCHVPHLRSALRTALTQLRPNAVALCDARDFSDFRLKSALGRYDGNVYPAIMDSAKRDPLNIQTDERGVGIGYEESLRKLIVGGAGEYHAKSVNECKGVSGTISRL